MSAQDNRSNFILAAAAMDSLRRDFTDGEPPFNPRVIFASEGGRTLGTKPE